MTILFRKSLVSKKDNRVNFQSALSLTLAAVLNSACLIESPVFAADEAQQSNTEESNITLRDVADSAGLKRNGADTLRVSFKDEDKTAFLEGLKGEKVIWRKPFTLPLEINPAKTDVMCAKGKLVILSQYPFSARFANLTYTFDGNALKLVETSQGDPSQDIVERLIKLSATGSRTAFDAYVGNEHAMFYPGSYVTMGNVERILKGGHKSANASGASGKNEAALDRLAITLEAAAYLIGLSESYADDKEEPANWIDAFTNTSINVDAKIWAPVVNDYGFYLQRCGRQKEAIVAFQAVIKALPGRTCAYLNLADSLYDSKSPKSARANYLTYREQMEKNGKSGSVPARVLERSK